MSGGGKKFLFCVVFLVGGGFCLCYRFIGLGGGLCGLKIRRPGES